jgi:hypothetical protein
MEYTDGSEDSDDTYTTEGDAEYPTVEASVSGDDYEQNVIPTGQPGGPGYEEPADVSNSPIAEPVEGYEQQQSVIPSGQPGGPPLTYDDDGNPAIYGLPPDGESGTGSWWGTAAPVVQCCVPLPAYQPSDVATEASGLAFIGSDAQSESLPGIDSNGDGIADFTTLDANQDGIVDSWFVDSTGSGTADSLYYDVDGDGLPEAVTQDLEGVGSWTQPELLPPQAMSVIPSGQPGGPPLPPDMSVRELSGEAGEVGPGQPPPPPPDLPSTPGDPSGTPMYDPQVESVIPSGQPGGPPLDPAVAAALAPYRAGPGANLAAVCGCTADPQAQAAIARIALAEPAPAPPPVLDESSDTVTPPPTGDPASESVPASVMAEAAQQELDAWQPETEPSQESFTDAGYSTEWGEITPQWAENGESPFPVSEPQQPLSQLVGPGHEADVYWAYQGNTNYCGLYSVRAVLSEMYGMDVDVNEMIQRADQNGWLVKENGVVKGIYPQDIEDILESYQIPSTDRAGAEGAWESLNTALANNQRVVLAIDAKEIDARANVGTEVPGVDWDHFVSISGVDYERGVVIINDSARSAGLELPIDVFNDAWADSNYRMTTTDIQAPATAGASPSGYAILGTTVEAQPAA